MKWRRFRMRTPEERGLILRAVLLLHLTEWGLRWFGFQRWKELIEAFSLPTSPGMPLPPDARGEMGVRAARAVRSAELHGMARPNCLVRSLALWWLLRLNSVDAELHIGARKVNGQLDAHAWIELGGRVLNDGVEVYDQYALFDAPIAAGASEPHAVGRRAFRMNE